MFREYQILNLMFVDPCIIVQFIKKIQQDATVYQNFIIPYLYEAQHVSGDTPHIIRSLKLHWQPLVFQTWKVVGRGVGGRCQAHTEPDNCCQCSFRLLMMGGVSPETCWASYKYVIIKVWYIVVSCWIFLHEVSNFSCNLGVLLYNVIYKVKVTFS